MRLTTIAGVVPCFATLFACSSKAPLATVSHVDIDRFMGDWYVIAHIPADAEEHAFNAVESYERRDDGKIATTYTFRDGGFDGELETLEPTGTVRDERTNATWGMSFFWPFEAEYLITYLDQDYETTIISRTKRDYVWIMSRSPAIEDARLDALVAELERQGYDVSRLRRVPQRWPDPGHPKSR